MGGRKGDREIILEVDIEHIFKYITENFCRKILQNGDIAAILPKHIEFEAICGTYYNWCEFEAGKKKNKPCNLHGCIDFGVIGECLNKVVQFSPKKR